MEIFMGAYSNIRKLQLKTVFSTIMISTKFEFHEAMLETLIEDDKKKFEQKKTALEDEQAKDSISDNWVEIARNETLLGMKISQERKEYHEKVAKIRNDIQTLRKNAAQEINDDWIQEKTNASKYIIGALEEADKLVDAAQLKINTLKAELKPENPANKVENAQALATPASNTAPATTDIAQAERERILKEISAIKHQTAKDIVDTLYQAALKVRSIGSEAQNVLKQVASETQTKEALLEMTIKQDKAKFVQDIADIVSKAQSEEAAANAAGESNLADQISAKMETDILAENKKDKETIAKLRAELEALKNGVQPASEAIMTAEAKKAGLVIVQAETKVKELLLVSQTRVDALEKELPAEQISQKNRLLR